MTATDAAPTQLASRKESKARTHALWSFASKQRDNVKPRMTALLLLLLLLLAHQMRCPASESSSPSSMKGARSAGCCRYFESSRCSEMWYVRGRARSSGC